MTNSDRKTLLILGAGTAGTMTANKLRKRLGREWTITVVAKDDTHDYKPSYLFIPFGMDRPAATRRSAHSFLADGIDLVFGDVTAVDPEARAVTLADGRDLLYDQLVIATGAHPRPDQTEGMLGAQWHRSVGEFYSLDGAIALRDSLASWTGGRLVMHITELPIMCPVAPLEFVLLADSFLRKKGVRAATEIVYVTPLDGAFTKPVASATLGHLLGERGIAIETDFAIERVDQDRRVIVSYDEREIPYDQLVTVPLHMGAPFVAASDLGDDLGFVTVDKHTMRHTTYPEIWALGDAANLPTSKAGAVAHFSVDVFVENFVLLASGKPLAHSFDGHANCFVESGDGKALLLDFNYETEPLTGTFPLPAVGPLRLLAESPVNHWGKRAFRWIYWNLLLPGRPLGLPSAMSMAGKVPASPSGGGTPDHPTPPPSSSIPTPTF